jgi:hypothetical protein
MKNKEVTRLIEDESKTKLSHARNVRNVTFYIFNMVNAQIPIKNLYINMLN